MATKKISELEAITEADDSDVLAIVDVSEGKTNKITKNNLLIGSGHSIEMSLNQETYALTLTLKNAAGTELSRASIDLPNENSITDISYNNGKLTLTKQSGTTTEVDITGLINGLVTESDFSTFTTQLNQVLQELDETKADAEDVEALQTRVTELEQENEDLKKNQLTNTPEIATSHYLQDSADSRFRKFSPIGRTTQESTTGKNLWNGDNIYLNQTYTQNSSIKLGYFEGEAGTYTISLTEKLPNGSYVYVGANGSIIPSMDKKATFTLAESGRHVVWIVIRAGTYTNFVSNIQIEQGSTATEYEPYTGGEPAPNPNYPYAIKNAGDNGTINEKVQNKNLLPFTNQDFTVNNVRYYVQDGSLYFNGTSTSETSSNNTNFKNNFNFILEAGTYKISHKTGVNVVYLYNYDNDSSSLITLGTDTTSQTLTLTKKTKLYIGFYVYQKTFNNINTEIMIEQGSTATSYVPHSEQNILLTLPEGMKLCKIGENADYFYKEDGKWYKHEVIKKIILTGNENWIYYTDVGVPFFFYTPDYTNIIKNKIVDNPIILCDYFQNRGKAYSPSGQGIFVNADLSGKIENGNLSVTTYDWGNNVETFKQFLREKKPEVYFAVKEPTEVEITNETLIAQLDAMQALRTYKNVTHISSEDETPANVEIEYVQDTKTYIDNKVTALTNAIISLGGNV